MSKHRECVEICVLQQLRVLFLVLPDKLDLKSI